MCDYKARLASVCILGKEREPGIGNKAGTGFDTGYRIKRNS